MIVVIALAIGIVCSILKLFNFPFDMFLTIEPFGSDDGIIIKVFITFNEIENDTFVFFTILGSYGNGVTFLILLDTFS